MYNLVVSIETAEGLASQANRISVHTHDSDE